MAFGEIAVVRSGVQRSAQGYCSPMEPHESRHCRNCLYDLTGVAPLREPGDESSADGAVDGALVWRCPECGREFDPEDPSTTRARPQSLWVRAARSRILRSGALLAVMLTLFYLTILPRPATSDWSRWEWLGRAYGAETTWNAIGRVRRHIWADRLTRLTTEDPDGENQIEIERRGDRLRLTIGAAGVPWQDIAWVVSQFETAGPPLRFDAIDEGRTPAPFSVRGDAAEVMFEALRLCGVEPSFLLARLPDDRWRLEVRSPQIGWGSIVSAFNSLRDKRYGVRIPPRPDASAGVSEIAPFEAAGTEADIFWTIVTAYDLELDAPERVPARSDGWHPTRPSSVAPLPAPPPRGGVAPAGVVR